MYGLRYSATSFCRGSHYDLNFDFPWFIQVISGLRCGCTCITRLLKFDLQKKKKKKCYENLHKGEEQMSRERGIHLLQEYCLADRLSSMFLIRLCSKRGLLFVTRPAGDGGRSLCSGARGAGARSSLRSRGDAVTTFNCCFYFGYFLFSLVLLL